MSFSYKAKDRAYKGAVCAQWLIFFFVYHTGTESLCSHAPATSIATSKHSSVLVPLLCIFAFAFLTLCRATYQELVSCTSPFPSYHSVENSMTSDERSIRHRRRLSQCLPSIPIDIKPIADATSAPPLSPSIPTPTNNLTKYYPQRIVSHDTTTPEIFAAHYPAFKHRVQGAPKACSTTSRHDVLRQTRQSTTEPISAPPTPTTRKSSAATTASSSALTKQPVLRSKPIADEQFPSSVPERWTRTCMTCEKSSARCSCGTRRSPSRGRGTERARSEGPDEKCQVCGKAYWACWCGVEALKGKDEGYGAEKEGAAVRRDGSGWLPVVREEDEKVAFTPVVGVARFV